MTAKDKLNFVQKDCICCASNTDPNYHDHYFGTVVYGNRILFISDGFNGAKVLDEQRITTTENDAYSKLLKKVAKYLPINVDVETDNEPF